MTENIEGRVYDIYVCRMVRDFSGKYSVGGIYTDDKPMKFRAEWPVIPTAPSGRFMTKMVKTVLAKAETKLQRREGRLPEHLYARGLTRRKADSHAE